MIGRAHAAAIVAGAALAATTAGTAPASTSAYNNCGTVSAGGRAWALASTGISCRVAKVVLKTLAAKAPSSGFHRMDGTYAQMKCNSIVGGGKHAFQCASRDARRTLTALSH
jgi:hypothetical protein